jgi:hypothetical protein
MAEDIQPRQSTQRSLDTMLDRARAFRVIKGGVSGDRPLGKTILLEGRDERMLTDLRHFLQIAGPEKSSFCFCSGVFASNFWMNRACARCDRHETHECRGIRLVL